MDVKKLEEIFQIVFDLDDDEKLAGFRRLGTKKWDSLAHVSLIAALESEFSLQLDAKNRERITSFSGTKLLLQEKLS
jgi:acyl carrier protein